jgi:hypothetical protein
VLSVEEIREGRPPEASIVRWLSIFAAVMWVPVVAHLYALLAALGMVFYVFGSFGVTKGRQAGRIMATIAAGVVDADVPPEHQRVHPVGHRRPVVLIERTAWMRSSPRSAGWSPTAAASSSCWTTSGRRSRSR